MRNVYFIRHGDIGLKDKRYIGMTDLPLSIEGREACRSFAEAFAKQRSCDGFLSIFSSPLIRAKETAKFLLKPFSLDGSSDVDGNEMVQIIPALSEINMGVMENVRMEEFQRDFPEEYEKRGQDIEHYKPEGGENFLEAERRFSAGLDEIVQSLKNKMQSDDVVIVSHSGVMRSFLCRLRGMPMDAMFTISFPYLHVEEVPFYEVESGILYDKYQVPANVVRHMRKVRDVAEEICSRVDPECRHYDRERIGRACLLHDLLRAERHHWEASADALEHEGMADIAGMVRMHHSSDIDEVGPLTEAEILFYADKCVQEDKVVFVDERFQASLKKCKTEEALRHHDALFHKTKCIARKIDAMCEC